MKTIGILGAGQLAQLLAHAAYPLGLKTLCYSDQADAPAARMSPIFVGSLKDEAALTAFAQQVDVVTLENENIPDNVLSLLQQYVDVLPGKAALSTSQDRWVEKSTFEQLGIPVPGFANITCAADIEAALNKLGCPAILKTRRFGYDGKGQFRLHTSSQTEEAWHAIGQQPAIVEGFVHFDKEVSQLAARNRQGDMVFYPLIHNHHEEGILRTSTFPYDDPELSALAQQHARSIMEHLDYVGVMAFEFFVSGKTLLANEIAPRVHNSGHLTIEGTQCSQFENHLRAITDLPLVKPHVTSTVRMENIIGAWPETYHQQDEHVYDYEKSPRPNRKLGHRIYMVK